MEHETGTSGSPQAPVAAPVVKRQGWLTRKLAGFYRTRDTIKAHPFWGTLFAFLAVILGAMVHEGYDYAKERIFGPDYYLVQMRNEQKQGFAQLQENLNKLGGSLDSQDREALASVKDSVRGLAANNAKLLDQLVIAKRENDNLRKIAAQRGGVAGGYDFILAADSGVRIDPTTVFGLQWVGNGAVNVNLSSKGMDKQTELSSGQSIAYTNARGRACKVSVLDIDSAATSASFAVDCAAS